MSDTMGGAEKNTRRGHRGRIWFYSSAVLVCLGLVILPIWQRLQMNKTSASKVHDRSAQVRLIPHWLQMNKTSASKVACIAYLRQVDGAIEQWALENKKKYGDDVTEDDLRPYLRDNALPVCPDSYAKISVTKVGEKPTCTSRRHPDHKI